MHLLKESQKSVHGVVRTAYMTVSDSSNFNLLEFLNTYPAQVNIILFEKINYLLILIICFF